MKLVSKTVLALVAALALASCANEGPRGQVGLAAIPVCPQSPIPHGRHDSLCNHHEGNGGN